MNRPLGTLALAFTLTIAGSAPVWAGRMQVHDMAESPQYGRKAGGMLGRGLLNAVTCFVDLIVNTVNETKNGPPLVGTLTGLARGAGCTVLRAGSGVIDVGTFWVPNFNGFPVSDSYDNCLNVGPTSMSAASPASSSTFSEAPSASASAGETVTASSSEAGSTTTGATTVRHNRRWKK